MMNTHEPQFLLLIAVVQTQDAENAMEDLTKLGASVTPLPSVGGFLGRRNTTLLIGIPKGDEGRIMKSLEENCRQRVEYISVPLESAPLPLPAPTPITVGGAAVFTFDVEHFEEI